MYTLDNQQLFVDFQFVFQESVILWSITFCTLYTTALKKRRIQSILVPGRFRIQMILSSDRHDM